MGIAAFFGVASCWKLSFLMAFLAVLFATLAVAMPAYGAEAHSLCTVLVNGAAQPVAEAYIKLVEHLPLSSLEALMANPLLPPVAGSGAEASNQGRALLEIIERHLKPLASAERDVLLADIQDRLRALISARLQSDAVQIVEGESGFRQGAWTIPLLAITSTAISPDGKSMIVGTKDGKLELWHTDRPELIKRFEIPNRPGRAVTTHSIRNLAFAHDGKWLTAVVDEYYAYIFDVESGRVLFTRGNLGFVLRVVPSSDLRDVWVAYCNQETHIDRVRIATGRKLPGIDTIFKFFSELKLVPTPVGDQIVIDDRDTYLFNQKRFNFSTTVKSLQHFDPRVPVESFSFLQNVGSDDVALSKYTLISRSPRANVSWKREQIGQFATKYGTILPSGRYFLTETPNRHFQYVNTLNLEVIDHDVYEGLSSKRDAYLMFFSQYEDTTVVHVKEMIRVYRPLAQKPVDLFPPKGKKFGMSWTSPHGNLAIIAYEDSDSSLWDLQTGEELLPSLGVIPSQIGWSDDEKTVILTADGGDSKVIPIAKMRMDLRSSGGSHTPR